MKMRTPAWLWVLGLSAGTPFVNAGFGGGTQVLTGAGDTSAGALVSLLAIVDR